VADRGASARGDCTHLALVIAFTVGATISVLVAYGIHNIGTSSGANTQAWLVYTAIGADLFSDGLATGAGSAINFQLGILIAVVQLFANIPGVFASAVNLRQRSVSKRGRAIASFSLFFGVLFCALAGFVLLREKSDVFQNSVLAGMIGFLLLATIEDMVPEADAPKPTRWSSSLAFTAGFVGMALISHLLSQSLAEGGNLTPSTVGVPTR